jgi:hypothetical protein
MSVTFKKAFISKKNSSCQTDMDFTQAWQTQNLAGCMYCKEYILHSLQALESIQKSLATFSYTGFLYWELKHFDAFL